MDFNPRHCRNESEVESKLIVQYLLPAVGYAVEDWHQEVALGSIRLDFLAFAAQVLPFTLDINSPLSLVVEAKSPNQKLDRHVRRLKQYLVTLHTKYGLLTNGQELRIYERIGNDIQAMFKCSGEEITDRIDEIKRLIGKESIKESQQREEVAQVLKTKKQGSVPMKVIAIYHNKGGVGKTTVSVNLAAALRRKGYKVISGKKITEW